MSFTTSTTTTSSPSTSARSPRPVRRRLTGGLVAAALVALGGLASVATAPTATAHDELVRTVPADGSTVATAPDQVVLTFSENPVPVGLEVKVTGPTGDVQQGEATLDGPDVVQPLLPSAPAGAYRVAWRATSEDGHATSGELTFTASAANARGATATPGAGGQTPSTAPSGTSSAPSQPGTTSTTEGAATAPATAPPVGSAPTSATTSSSTSPVAIAVIVVVLLVLAGIALALRRRSGGSGTPA